LLANLEDGAAAGAHQRGFRMLKKLAELKP
jgi:hypothetical protein